MNNLTRGEPFRQEAGCVIKAGVPEIDRENLKVAIEGDILMASGGRAIEREEKGRKDHPGTVEVKVTWTAGRRGGRRAAREDRMKVEQVMTRDVKLCRPHETLNEAARLMWDHACGCVPVADEEDRVVGMLTDRDICMAAYTRGLTLSEMTVESAMSSQIFACHIGDSLDTAETLMRAHQVRRLPVLGFEGRVVGLLSLSDIVREAEKHRGQRLKDLSPDTIRATLAAVTHVRERHVVREI